MHVQRPLHLCVDVQVSYIILFLAAHMGIHFTALCCVVSCCVVFCCAVLCESITSTYICPLPVHILFLYAHNWSPDTFTTLLHNLCRPASDFIDFITTVHQSVCIDYICMVFFVNSVYWFALTDVDIYRYAAKIIQLKLIPWYCTYI